jgi:UDP-N-acetylmuramoylalanine--D-glutamate ligase
MIRANTFAGKHVAVFGLGSSGNATVRALQDGGATVSAWDDSEAGRAAAEKAGVPVVDLSKADWRQFSSLVLAPGVPLTHPEPHWTVKMAAAAGVEIIGDIEIFCRERAACCPDAPFIAISGTNGKSTTTALVAHILTRFGKDVHMGGNIGRAILTLEPPAPDRFHVIELSSFQIDLTPSLNPSIGVLLNVTPDHLDRHGTIDLYAAVKERLIAGSDVACVCIDDDYTREVLKRRMEQGPVVAMSVKKRIAPGYCIDGANIVCANPTGLAVKLGDLSGIATLRGAHNAQNAVAAVAAVREILNLRMESTDRDWQGVLASFPGLAHRMEEIGTLGKAGGRILFINDSKATNADSTEKALLSFPRDVYWILGGKPKDGGIETLIPYFPGVRKAYLIGAATDEFAATLDGKVAFERCGTIDSALAAATRDANASPAPEPVVLLSPACASYDQFKNFEVRGEAFRALVSALPGISMRRG